MNELEEKANNLGIWYESMAIKPVDYIQANNIPFVEGCIIKYVSRWRRKDGILDLYKARFYIERLISQEEQNTSIPPPSSSP